MQTLGPLLIPESSKSAVGIALARHQSRKHPDKRGRRDGRVQGRAPNIVSVLGKEAGNGVFKYGYRAPKAVDTTDLTKVVDDDLVGHALRTPTLYDQIPGRSNFSLLSAYRGTNRLHQLIVARTVERKNYYALLGQRCRLGRGRVILMMISLVSWLAGSGAGLFFEALVVGAHLFGMGGHVFIWDRPNSR